MEHFIRQHGQQQCAILNQLKAAVSITDLLASSDSPLQLISCSDFTAVMRNADVFVFVHISTEELDEQRHAFTQETITALHH